MSTTTIILTVSREEFLTEVLSSIELLDCDQTYTNILCIVDGDAKMFTKVRNLVQKTKFNERLTVQYPDRKQIKRFDTVFRRKRIAAIHKWAQQFVGISEFIFLTEDDTLVPRDALKKLEKHIRETPGCVMAEGVEVGRWGIPYVGAWKFDDIYEPNSVTSLVYKRTGVEQIDAGGFYCTLMRAANYKEQDFELFESLGPDISMGLFLRRDGYVNLIDWSIPCRHLNITRHGVREVLVPNEDVRPTTIKRKSPNNWSIY